MRIVENAELLQYNTFRLHAKAKRLLVYDNLRELTDFLSAHKGEDILPVGQGSNILFTRDFLGSVLVSNMNKTSSEGDLWTAESGVVMDELIAQTLCAGYSGLENLSHIPGVVGAAAVQNIGAYGVELKDRVEEVEALYVPEMKVVQLSKTDCQYAYRDSFFKHQQTGSWIVLKVSFRLSKDNDLVLDYGHLRKEINGEPTAEKVREAVVRIRRQKLPEVNEVGSAGSFFKNPFVGRLKAEQLLAKYPSMPHFEQDGKVKIPAAWLIEQTGWKNKQVGGARVWHSQPLVLTNTGNATSGDILSLSRQIVDSIIQKFGITIEPEVVFV